MSALTDRPSAEARAAVAEQAERHLQPVDIFDLASAEPIAPRFAIEPLAPLGVVTLLGGHGGCGKSLLALTWCAHHAVGQRWAGFGMAQGPAAFVSLEDPGELVRYRLKRICETFNLDPGAVARNLRVFDGSDSDATLVNEVAIDGSRTIHPTATWKEFTEEVAGCKLIAIDNASDAFSADENSRRQVRGFMRMLTGIAKDNDSALLLLAHIDKSAARFGSAGNSYSGSTGWHNSARSRLALVADGDRIELRHEKANLSRLADPTPLIWNTHTGVLIVERQDGQTCDRVTMQQSDDAEVMAAIKEAQAIVHPVNTARSGHSTTWHSLQTIAATPRWAKSSSGKARFWESINRLVSRGAIADVEYKNSERKVKHRFEVRQ